MNKIFFILTLSIFLIKPGFSQKEKEYYIKFDIQKKSEIDRITQIISIDNVKGNTIYAYALQHELEQFKKLGYKIEFIDKIAPKSVNMAVSVSEMENWDRYPTYEVYRQMMKNFQANYPEICKLDSIGTTHDGRKLYTLKISDNVNDDETEPEFFYTSTMHGDETTGFILMLRLADSLLSSYGNANEITELINSIELFINPNANPDGTYAGGNNTVVYATRSNGYADINRDFPDPRTGANSPYQPETQAMMDFAKAHNFVISANFHGGAEVMNYPWDTWYLSENLHADTEWFEKVCTDYVTTARTIYSNYMKDVTSDGVTHGATWYKVNGGRQDYMNYWHHCKEITIELSSTKILPTESLNNYWNYNKQSLINLIKESLYGIKGTVKNISGDPLKAMIWIEDHDEINDSSMVYSNPYFGDYYRPIDTGEFNITAYAEGYVPTTIENISTEYNTLEIINFILEVADTCALTGIITNSSNGNPVENATIKISNHSSYSSVTNGQGNYFIENIPENNYEIIIEKEGFTRYIADINLRHPDTIYNFAIDPAEIENFESNDFSQHDWQNSGNADWEIDESIYYEGDYSAKSGTISHSQSSSLILEADIKNGGILSFYKKVSSESGYDYLRFYIDDIEQQKWSGELNWSVSEYEINSGKHTFKWTYTKDEGVSSGSDCAWIDMISFPMFVSEINSDETLDKVTESSFTIYPNPFKTYLEIEFYSNFENITIEIFSISGVKIFENNYDILPNTKNHIIIYENQFGENPLNNRLYYLQIRSLNKVLITKQLLKF